MLSEIYKELEGSGSIYDFADAVVIVRLRAIRNMWITESELLVKKKRLTEGQREDLEELTNDIAAINRVLGFLTVPEEVW
jgi:hypothetical protein